MHLNLSMMTSIRNHSLLPLLIASTKNESRKKNTSGRKKRKLAILMDSLVKSQVEKKKKRKNEKLRAKKVIDTPVMGHIVKIDFLLLIFMSQL